ncbi:Transcriptional repressor frmR [Raoultella terrigena]|uniref:Transcriptional repressor FrmR n=1 Tax=Raoultella terrigena TaxID=577 RepID=A0A4U9CZE0_RAOTE|nr:Transcriptional repressor frmR [Raoultella terrigena]
MPHSPEDKKRALSRVRRIRGQVEALERALESGESCMTILQQIASIRGATNGLMGEMVEIHLQDELVKRRNHPRPESDKNGGSRPSATILLKINHDEGRDPYEITCSQSRLARASR